MSAKASLIEFCLKACEDASRENKIALRWQMTPEAETQLLALSGQNSFINQLVKPQTLLGIPYDVGRATSGNPESVAIELITKEYGRR